MQETVKLVIVVQLVGSRFTDIF